MEDELKGSDVIEIIRLELMKFNMIVSGTGSGKSYYIANNLIKQLKEIGIDIKPYEILFVSSRRITIDQQVEQYKHLEKFTYDNLLEFDITTLTKTKDKIPSMTYNQFAYDLKERDSERKRFVDSAKIIVFDEIHSIIDDKHFVKDMEKVKEYIEDRINSEANTTYFIGMTATDDLIDDINVEVNDMLDMPIYNYKVENIWTTTPVRVFALLQMLEGNSIVMTSTIKEAKDLQNKIGSCARIIVSKHNKEEFTEDMKELIQHINRHKALPSDVKVLITTSCMREGISLEPNGNFKIDNCIVYGGTIVNVIQFVGRYRGNIRNLCIVDTGFGKGVLCEKQQEQLNLFKEYINYGEGFETYASYLLPICKSRETVFHKPFKIDETHALFIDYIVENWLGRLIWTKEQKQEIVNKVNDLGLRKYCGKKHTFPSVVRVLQLRGFDFDYVGGQVKISHQFKQKHLDIDFGDKKKIQPYKLSDNEKNRKIKVESIS